MKNLMVMLMALLSLSMVACGKKLELGSAFDPKLPKVGVPNEDGVVVHGRAVYTITNEELSALHKFMNKLLVPSAYAATGSTTVSYNNVASTNFSINVTNFTPGSITSDILSLGSVSINSLNDNNLNVCGTGTQKCGKAIIRVYTTGATAGFVNTTYNYGVPVYTGSLNPTSAVGLDAAGSVQVQTYTIAANKNVMKIQDLSSPTYNVTADFSNAGAGTYQMTYVVEYALSLN